MTKTEFFEKYKFTTISSRNTGLLDERAIKDINFLLPQLTDKPGEIDLEKLIGKLKPGNMVLVVATHGAAIIGIGTICFMTKLTCHGAEINDIVVDEKYRRERVGEEILSRLVAAATERLADEVNLTCRPSREAGNSMYAKHGFQQRETNVWQLKLDE